MGAVPGRGFIVGNGERIPNEGQATVNLRAVGEKGQPIDFKLVFQSARVTRPLMSVAKICQHGYGCHFAATNPRSATGVGRLCAPPGGKGVPMWVDLS